MGVLEAEDVLAIDKSLRDGVPQQELADEFGISPQSVSAINMGRAWSAVTGRPWRPRYGKPRSQQDTGRTLAPDDVLAIDKMLREGVRGTVIAKEFAVTDRTVSAIKLGRNWGRITGREEAPLKFRRKSK